MITKLLSAAVKFYLRSQVSRVEDLQVKIAGKNSQIIKGYIPQVSLSGKQVAYRGLHLQEVSIDGTDIAFNLPEVLRKKPLQLLEPIIVDLKVSLAENDLMASIDSDLLQSGLSDLWQIILSAPQTTLTDSQLVDSSIEWNKIAIANKQLNISGIYQDNNSQDINLNVSTQITSSDGHTLCLFPLKISNGANIVDELTEKLEIDLGNDVDIQKLVVESEQILCLGKITVNN